MNARLCSVGIVMLLGSVARVHANIVSTSGAVQEINPPADVRVGKVENTTVIYLFIEQTGITTSLPIGVDISASGTSDGSGASLSPAAIEAGARINSYYVHYDKVGGGGALTSASGSIAFDEEILGLIITGSSLNATNAYPGHPNTLYPTSTNQRVETGDGTSITLSADRKTVSFQLVVGPYSDDIRVITKDGNATSPNINNGNENDNDGGPGPVPFDPDGLICGNCGTLGGPGLGLLPLMLVYRGQLRRRVKCVQAYMLCCRITP